MYEISDDISPSYVPGHPGRACAGANSLGRGFLFAMGSPSKSAAALAASGCLLALRSTGLLRASSQRGAWRLTGVLGGRKLRASSSGAAAPLVVAVVSPPENPALARMPAVSDEGVQMLVGESLEDFLAQPQLPECSAVRTTPGCV